MAEDIGTYMREAIPMSRTKSERSRPILRRIGLPASRRAPHSLSSNCSPSVEFFSHPSKTRRPTSAHRCGPSANSLNREYSNQRLPPPVPPDPPECWLPLPLPECWLPVPDWPRLPWRSSFVMSLGRFPGLPGLPSCCECWLDPLFCWLGS